MTIEEWAKDFKSFVNELQMPRDDYKGIMGYIDDALALLKEQPEIVRCKDCKYCREAHYEEDGEPPIIKLKCENKYGLCRYQAEPDGFCSQGERKDSDKNAVV